MAVVIFDYGLWAELYPALSDKVSEAQAANYFVQATMILSNAETSPVCDVTQRQTLLYLLVAHIATLGLPEEAGGTGMMGRISKATEGSVSVESTLGNLSSNATWFAQTPYGLQYWQMTVGLRGFRYRPGPRPMQDPFALRFGRRW